MNRSTAAVLWDSNRHSFRQSQTPTTSLSKTSTVGEIGPPCRGVGEGPVWIDNSIVVKVKDARGWLQTDTPVLDSGAVALDPASLAKLAQLFVGALFFVGGGIWSVVNARKIGERVARVIGLAPGEHWPIYTASVRVLGGMSVVLGLYLLLGLATGFVRLG